VHRDIMPVRMLTRLTETDIPALQALLERCADYYRDVGGRAVAPDDARTLFDILPPGTTRADKHLFGVGDFSGVTDLISDWPAPGTWLIGFLLLEPAARNRGLGPTIVAAVEAYAGDRGAQRLRVGVEQTNPRALRFWEGQGFVHVTPARPDAWALERLLAQ
jgi:GNAT superfamily N-acetyltransferase